MMKSFFCTVVTLLICVQIAFDGFAKAQTLDNTGNFIRTPAAPKAPRINGPKIFGAHPGHPFLYHLPVTGDRPIACSAEELPQGLSLDGATGNITGSVAKEGRYPVKFTAKNALGKNSKTVLFVVGRTICLTPPLGWNSWNCFGGNIDEAKIRSAADAMVKTGLIDHGWTYINMDDRWEGERGSDGRIHSSAAIPDMKGMVDYIHGLGLKVGLYSSPGPQTCAGAPGSYQHEDQDAQAYADWGIDYLKYDWCSYDRIAIQRRAEKFTAALPDSAADIKRLADKQYDLMLQYAAAYGSDAEHVAQRDKLSAQEKDTRTQLEAVYHKLNGEDLQKIWDACDREPYYKMDASLQKVNRDILYSFCQYGMANVETWGAQAGGNTWRVTGDIGANWKSVEEHGFQLKPGLEKWAGPGHWNDPDMLEIGNGDLTPDENYTHMTLWCMLASPLLIGCDMPKMTPFTLSLFNNDEVLAVSQDSLGKQGTRLKKDGKTEVWVKPLDDGTQAVAFFNCGDAAADVAASWGDLGLSGKQPVRDLWRQKDVGPVEGRYSVSVAKHGAELFRIGTPK